MLRAFQRGYYCTRNSSYKMAVFAVGLSSDELAKCKATGKEVIEVNGSEMIKVFQEREKDLKIINEDHDKVIMKSWESGAEGATYALFRKQIPVLVLDGKSDKIPLCSELLHIRNDIDAFITPKKVRGRIFTIEGGDGAGKETQTRMLVERLSKEGYPVKTLDFPHDSAMYGKKIREILSGVHGGISDVSPVLFATIYSMNRYDKKPSLDHWLEQGYNVILDRYMESSYGHQAAKLETDDERIKLIERLAAFEQKWLGIPASHRVLYLDLNPDVALKALQADGTRAGLDIHEIAKSSYKQDVRKCFRWCCDKLPEWAEIPQLTADDTRKTREAVHEEIWDSLKSEFVNKA
eukprot:TRINITY_DN12591_c0_g1_i1.p1 TRINITY_DN12591_c0_g1~~TRINITY_DN12591_c0_g1_i1.p1  ORF type:complete len:350 (+),score=76.51 TRINITY_DN12591_c0_g1_i1:33-1082(+)